MHGIIVKRPNQILVNSNAPIVYNNFTQMLNLFDDNSAYIFFNYIKENMAVGISLGKLKYLSCSFSYVLCY